MLPVLTDSYDYPLPEERIAKYPLPVRHDSRLLIFQQGNIVHSSFLYLYKFISQKSLLVFNDTKVLQARLKFKKSTGAIIEIFCLEPLKPYEENEITTPAGRKTLWKCLIGNLKRWKSGEILTKSSSVFPGGITLTASLISDFRDGFLVEFGWNREISFMDILNIFGETPLPPYIKRAAEDADRLRYQTVYAHHNGAVAAPTAGLHFTDEVFRLLETKQIKKDFLTLHVSAGTFQPIRVLNPEAHPMHKEHLYFSKSFIENLYHHCEKIVCVGTTSLRALESLYWYGLKLRDDIRSEFFIDKLIYRNRESDQLSPKESLEMVLEYLEKNKLEGLSGCTEIFIFPTYSFHFADGLITNFHQPRSTLLMLIAAFIGDEWRKIYQSALENNYRFLSYGDSMLLLR